MGFVDAVKSGLSKYATFSGRARRSEFWWFYLFWILAYVAALAVDVILGNEQPIVAYTVIAALLIPLLAVQVRRLHDTGHSGWSLLISLIPLAGAIWWLVVMVRDSEPQDNQYGLWPKYTPEQLGEAPAS